MLYIFPSHSVYDRAAAMASHSIPLPILDDLGSRFIINIPDEERKDIIRIMFQVGGRRFELSESLFFPNGAIYT